MAGEFQVTGRNAAALFTLKIHRGDGMALLAMNWKAGQPPRHFVGFAIEYKEPGGAEFFTLKNRLNFLNANGTVNKTTQSSRLSPIQKFRWVHFPRNAEMAGEFLYRVTPVFMATDGALSFGDFQEAAIELRRETYPGLLNVTFTRGFVSSQAFVDRFITATDGIDTLLPKSADAGLDFVPTHPKADEALKWMGFEARSAILEVLDLAIADKKAKVRVIAFDLTEPAVLTRLEKLGKRLKIIIDDSKDHKDATTSESRSAERLRLTAGPKNVKRQHMDSLQHNKTIVVDGPKGQIVVCGSTNFTWRGLYIQNNNAIVMHGGTAVQAFGNAFDNYFQFDKGEDFGATGSAEFQSLGLEGIDASVAFSPHIAANAALDNVAKDVATAKSNVFYSLAFLAQTGGSIREEITKITLRPDIFVYGITDKKMGGFDLLMPDGNTAPVSPANLAKNLPEPFKSEPSGLAGSVGTRMHHKFVVIDFDKPSARVYMGSHNFSPTADNKNGENLLLIRDRRIATSYMIEALRIFDHYHFRVAQAEATKAKKTLALARAPKDATEQPWFAKDYTDPRRIRDRELFA